MGRLETSAPLSLAEQASKILAANAEEADRKAELPLAISPDLGERYLDTVYRSAWRDEMFGEGSRKADHEP
ncbi:hypothetical protein [Glycomyces buryatensis]|uniref:hypothetical protein n=1 Tax=Glycomyces buryatensis TaxID=2570927 RepID=UPI001B3C15C4|nr:hypothetical protein [Glycomyces buryatensis]